MSPRRDGSPRRLGLALAAGAALGAVVGADVACNKKPDISFSLRVPSSVLDRVQWYEIGAFADGKCPSAEQFAAQPWQRSRRYGSGGYGVTQPTV